MARTNPPRPSPSRSRSTARPIDYQARGARDVSPLDLGLIELPTRPRSIYTMGMRKAAIEACENGYLRDAADLTLAAITESGYLRGILADLTQGIWGLPRHWTGRTDMIDELDDSPDRVGEFRVMFPDADAMRLTSWGITLGVAPGQMRRRYDARPSYDYPISPEEAADWKNVKRQPVPTRPIGACDTRVLRTWSPKYLRNQWWNDEWWLLTADGEIRISPIDDDAPEVDARTGVAIKKGNPDEWMLYTPYGVSKPWEWGAWKSATLAFVAERDATFDRLRHSEVLGPVRVGKVPAGTTEAQRRKYLKVIKEMQRMGAFVLPPGLEYSVVEGSGRIADIYDKIIEWARGEYAMMTGALTTATGSAGFAKGDVQERFTRSILSFFASTLASCFWQFGLVPWARENYGSNDAPRPAWDTAAPEDKLVKAQTIKTAGEALKSIADSLALAGLRITRDSAQQYAQSLGFSVEEVPAEQARGAKIDLAPTDKAKWFRGREIRAGEGYPPFGDERDDMTGPELDAMVAKSSAPAPEVDNIDDPGGEPPDDEHVSALAVAMTQHAIERCEHGACNRCRKCGVERLRGFDMGPDGQPKWKRAWRPIPRVANGASARPMISMGGDA